MSETTIYSIGHSNQSIDEFLDLLSLNRIGALVDVRRYPTSRRLPHFGRQALASAVKERDIAYHWFESLGGHREEGLGDASPNHGLRDESFRNYADYMLSDTYGEAVKSLLEIAGSRPAAVMCAEASYHHCHRRLLCDYLTVAGVEVLHILSDGSTIPHELTDAARSSDRQLTYPEVLPLFD